MMAEWEWNDGKFHYGLLRTLTWGSITREGENRRAVASVDPRTVEMV
jgi:hypothetical protein